MYEVDSFSLLPNGPQTGSKVTKGVSRDQYGGFCPEFPVAPEEPLITKKEDRGALRRVAPKVDSSTAYQHEDFYRNDAVCPILNMKLLQFYYSN
jgi:hypothetical protein